MAQNSKRWPRQNKKTIPNSAFSMVENTSTTINIKSPPSKQVSILTVEIDNGARSPRVVVTVWSDPPLFIVLKQSAGGQAAAPAGAYMAQSRQYVMPQQASTPAQLGLAATIAAAPALQQWLAANSAPSQRPDIDSVNTQINILKEQITQSENNLNAQHTVSAMNFSSKIMF